MLSGFCALLGAADEAQPLEGPVLEDSIVEPSVLEGVGPLDGQPWPWGGECPVYTQFLEGRWSAMSPRGRGHKVYSYFEVRAEAMADESMWRVHLLQFSLRGTVLAQGQIFFYQGSQGVRVPLYAQASRRCSYWAFIRSYTRQPDNQECINESDAVAQKSTLRTWFASEQVMLIDLEPMQLRRGPVCRPKTYFLNPEE